MSKKSLSGNSALKKTITQLESLVIERQQQVDALCKEQRRLSTYATGVQAIARQAHALLELGKLTRASSNCYACSSSSLRHGSATAPAPGSCMAEADAAAPAEAAASPHWLEQHVMQITQDLDPDGVNGQLPNGGLKLDAAAALPAGEADQLPLGWSPAAAAARAAAGCVLTTSELRQELRDFVLTCAPLLM